MNACGTGELGESCDASLDVRRGHHHQVGKLIDDANNVRQLAVWHFIQSKLVPGDSDCVDSGSLFGSGL